MIRLNLAKAGVDTILANQSYPFNWTILFGFLLLAFGIFFTSAFVVHDAGTIADYTQSIYAVSLITLIIFAFLALILSAESLFDFFERSDDLVNTSECGFQSGYTEQFTQFILSHTIA